MPTYIHKLPDWPSFQWNPEALARQLANVRLRQGRLIGQMQALGFQLQEEAVLATLTEDVLKSSEIEGEILDKDQVRSSIARRLGIDAGALSPADRNVEGVVEMMLDATQKFSEPLTSERLFGWHASLSPTGRSGMSKIAVGAWRDGKSGPMQVVSGAVGREKVHYEAPDARKLDSEMSAFLDWFNKEDKLDPVIKAALAHLWFVTIHPFDDGNGRIARAVADMLLARSEESPQRFYSMSAQIRIERKAYYDMLERTQKANLDVTPWLEWFLSCLDRAFDGAEKTLAAVLQKAEFWKRYANVPLNERQRDILNRMLDGFVGKLTSGKWATIEKCSTDTALRDISELLELGMLRKDLGGGRSTSYSLAEKESLPRRQTDPAWLQDYFLSTGRDETTRSATFTFIKRNNRHYAVTCRHILEAVSNKDMVPNAKNPTIAMQIDKTVLNLSYFTAKGLAQSSHAPLAETRQEEIDVAIAPIDSRWQLLTNRKNKVAIDLDNWREPKWPTVKYCLAAGYPDEHKKRLSVGDNEMLANPFFVVVAEAASRLGRTERIITLQSDLGKPHGYYFSGMSGGPVYAIEGGEQREVEDEELFPIGIIFEGYPSSGRKEATDSRNSAMAFLSDSDLFFRALILTPEIFDEWLQKAGLV